MKSELSLTLKKNKKGSPIPRYFQGGCINVLRIAFHHLKHWISPISYSFQLTWRWSGPTCITYLRLLSYQNQSMNYVLLFHIPTKLMINKEKKTFLSGFLWNISFPGWHFLELYGLQQKFLSPTMVATFGKH